MTSWGTRTRWAAATGLLSGALLLSPWMTQRAQACGGFWCSQQAPVNQAAEQIIFIDHPDDRVTAIIQIQYSGPSERFAWLIPIAGDPEVAVSSNMAFSRLEVATRPSYALQPTIQGTCKQQTFPTGAFGNAAAAGAGGGFAPMSAGGGPSISVVSQGSVGPYGYTTIAVDPELEDPADAAIDWFMKEGYDLTGVDAELLGPYLAEGLNLLAFKLTKSSGTQSGSIRPVMLTYQSDRPMIPIRPTAVAATSDMGVKVWVSGATQAVPDNYKALVLNDALINWFSFQSNYDQVVTAAANEAGGQGFVTELARSTVDFAQTIYTPQDIDQWERLTTASYAEPFDALLAAAQLYSAFDGWRETIEETVTLTGVSFDQFIAAPWNQREAAQLDTQVFFFELRKRVLEPLAETQRLFNSRPYLTRLYSTMSADEMTVDPAFAFNPDLAEVDNVHLAKQFIQCNPSVTVNEAPWIVHLPQGGVVRGRSRAWPIPIDSMPVNLKIVQLSTSGSGRVVEDNTEVIGNALFERSNLAMAPAAPGVPALDGLVPGTMTIGGTQQVSVTATPPAGGFSDGSDEVEEDEDDGPCAVAAVGADSGGPGAFGLLGLAALAFGWRRRRRS